MKHFLAIIFAVIFMNSFHINAAEQSSSEINWLTNYDEALAQSKSSGKPVVLFFTGSDWCSWCKKIDSEVFLTQEFVKNAGDKFIFVKVDFPSKNTLPSDVVAQNKELKKKYNITGFPTLIILNSDGQQIGNTGYRPGGGAAYAAHLNSLVSS